ncbi:hypothetical protein M419DRAFT_8361 [Trichoderma reesei RUT C-30]|uniref:Uncharacterized protein n=1 Tax=Hypocrea jecorina (strain ATCC 56765 / BCRC 32924 / NRRL 11460 / Rut C-30) TaxID=1344414 RepID=A0A024SAC2_HYPJR|nr:hypothetical protein M419DRAFT_8361 [Trichoderma reesei RUT C-30]
MGYERTEGSARAAGCHSGMSATVRNLKSSRHLARRQQARIRPRACCGGTSAAEQHHTVGGPAERQDQRMSRGRSDAGLRSLYFELAVARPRNDAEHNTGDAMLPPGFA